MNNTPVSNYRGVVINPPEEELESPKARAMRKSIVPGFLRVRKLKAIKKLESYEKASPFKINQLNLIECDSETFNSASSSPKRPLRQKK